MHGEFQLRPWAAACLALVISGCADSWRPAMDSLQPDAPQTELDLKPYWQSMSGKRLTFQRSEPGDTAVAPDLYPVEFVPSSGKQVVMLQGTFSDTSPPPLDRCLAQDRNPPAVKLAWPDPANDKYHGLFLEFDPPVSYLPANLTVGERFRWSGNLRLFNSSGHLDMRGTIEREVELEGYETMSVGEKSFEHCPRIRIDTQCHLHWGPDIRLTEYFWLAPDVGIVRRIERLSGLIWLIYFRSFFDYELVGVEPLEGAESGPTNLPPLARAAVWLDRLAFRPRIGGIIAEFSDQTARANELVVDAESLSPPSAGPGSSNPP